MTAAKRVLGVFKLTKLLSIKRPSVLACLLLGGGVISASSLSLAQTTPSVQSDQVLSKMSIAQDKLGIDADLVAGDDYYFRKNGQRVQYLRKQGVYILPQALGERQLSTLSNLSAFNNAINKKPLTAPQTRQPSTETASPTTVFQTVQQHRLGSRSVVRLSTISPQAFEKTVKGAKPVLANPQGQGDLEVLPAVTIKLVNSSSKETVVDALQTIQKRFKLSMVRRLRVSGHVYSFTMNEPLSDVAQVFGLVRSLMKDSRVDWAEPQFNAAPIKHAIANDSLFTQQWHLHNTTQQGALCDADCDATLAWDSHTGNGTVIAVIDDGVELDHPDLEGNIWENTLELEGAPGVDDDGNGYIDDVNGFDFVNDANSCDGDAVYSGDGIVGPDNDPSPQAISDCLLAGDDVIEDDHGTAVAGIAAAVGNNNRGVTGVAYNAKILPIRAISNYDTEFISQGVDFCARIAEAMTYAGRHADVINNSWEILPVCTSLEEAIDDVVAGTIMDGGNNVSKRPNLGSPVIFSAGNSASGWYKVTVDNVRAGQRQFEWRFTRSSLSDPFRAIDDVVWIDNIQWPDGSIEGFEGNGFGSFQTGCDINQCTLTPGECSLDTSSCDSIWELNNDAARSRGGVGRSLKADLSSDADAVCDYTYLTTSKTVTSGSMSFWIWVSADLSFDKVEFLIDGREQSSFGDVPVFVNNDVSYPASLSSTIAVGASTDGEFMNANNGVANPSQEERVYYSQYGASLDLVAPSGNQHQGITTTDRTGVNGFNDSANLACNPVNDSCDYTNTFGGTSASAPMVSGAAAIMLSAQSNLTAAQVRTHLQNGADQIGVYTYGGGVSDETGHGRLNIFQSLKLAQGSAMASTVEACGGSSAYVIDPLYALIDKKDFSLNMCQSQVFVEDEFCFPIKAQNGNVAMICL